MSRMTRWNIYLSMNSCGMDRIDYRWIEQKIISKKFEFPTLLLLLTVADCGAEFRAA